MRKDMSIQIVNKAQIQCEQTIKFIYRSLFFYAG